MKWVMGTISVSRGHYTGYEVLVKENNLYTVDADMDLDGNEIHNVAEIDGERNTNVIEEAPEGWILDSTSSLRFRIGGAAKLQMSNTLTSFENNVLVLRRVPTQIGGAAENSAHLFLRPDPTRPSRMQLVCWFSRNPIRILATEP